MAKGHQEAPKLNLSTPAGFIAAGNFYLTDTDIIYVNASGTSLME